MCWQYIVLECFLCHKKRAQGCWSGFAELSSCSGSGLAPCLWSVGRAPSWKFTGHCHTAVTGPNRLFVGHFYIKVYFATDNSEQETLFRNSFWSAANARLVGVEEEGDVCIKCIKMGASRGVWAAGRGRFSFPSALPWGGPICSAVSSAGLPSSRKMRSCWRESSGGLRG